MVAGLALEFLHAFLDYDWSAPPDRIAHNLIQEQLLLVGGLDLVVDLIAEGIPRSIQVQAMRLGIKLIDGSTGDVGDLSDEARLAEERQSNASTESSAARTGSSKGGSGSLSCAGGVMNTCMRHLCGFDDTQAVVSPHGNIEQTNETMVTAQERVCRRVSRPGSETFFFALEEQIAASRKHAGSELRQLQQRSAATKLRSRAVSEDRSSGAIATNSRSLAERRAEPVQDPWSITCVVFLQRLMEGHYAPAQGLVRAQPGATSRVNILETLVGYLSDLTRLIVAEPHSALGHVRVVNRVLECMVEAVQGPCLANQEYLALGTELLDGCNRLIGFLMERCTGRFVFEAAHKQFSVLQQHVAALLMGLLEGRRDKVVHTMMLGVIDFNRILELVRQMRRYIILYGRYARDTQRREERRRVFSQGAALSALILTLGDFDRVWFRETAEGHRALRWFQRRMAHIEVVWQGRLQTVHFPTPELYGFRVKASMDRLVEEVDRSNYETKLRGFVQAAPAMLEEMRHQQRLAEAGLSWIFSGQMLAMAQDISFKLALLINALLLLTYQWENGKVAVSTESTPISFVSSDAVRNLILYLGLTQAFTSGFILLSFLILRVPMMYEACGRNVIVVLIRSNAAYYLLYSLVAFLGALPSTSYIYFSFHLLDIVNKDPTTRTVIDSVLIPVEQLVMTAILGAFVLFIFSFVQFATFPIDFGDSVCRTEWSCFVGYLNWGVRNGGGIGDALFEWSSLTHGSNWFWYNVLFSFIFFAVITITLLSIIFGIIIDTFGEMREEKGEKLEEMLNNCFICDMETAEFELNGISWSEHIGGRGMQGQHNMWDYLQFIVHLMSKPTSSFNGIEQFVAEQLKLEGIRWFPTRRSAALEEIASTKAAEKGTKERTGKGAEVAGEHTPAVAKHRVDESAQTARTACRLLSKKMEALNSDVGQVLMHR
jgi:hypothetical protein